jgi:hypothetical protein
VKTGIMSEAWEATWQGTFPGFSRVLSNHANPSVRARSARGKGFYPAGDWTAEATATKKSTPLLTHILMSEPAPALSSKRVFRKLNFQSTISFKKVKSAAVVSNDEKGKLGVASPPAQPRVMSQPPDISPMKRKIETASPRRSATLTPVGGKAPVARKLNLNNAKRIRVDSRYSADSPSSESLSDTDDSEEVKSFETTACEACAHLGDDSEMILCDRCDKGYHTYCLVPRLDSIPAGEWLCGPCVEENRRIDTVACEVCRSFEDDDNMLLCDKCDKGFHMYCLKPILVNVPVASWFCKSCADASDGDIARRFNEQKKTFVKNQTKIYDFFRIKAGPSVFTELGKNNILLIVLFVRVGSLSSIYSRLLWLKCR